MSLGSNGLIGCIRCQNLWCEFMARSFELIAPVQPFCNEFRVVTEHCQLHPTTMKRTKSWVSDPMGWIDCVRYKKLWCEFVARTFELIAPVQPVLHWVSCSNETLPNAPKHYETHQNMTLGSNGVDRVRSLPKITMRVDGTSFWINCTSSARFARVSCSNGTLPNAPILSKHTKSWD